MPLVGNRVLIDCFAAKGATFFVRGFGCALFIFEVKDMKLFYDEEFDEAVGQEPLPDPRTLPISKLFHELTRDYPDQYLALESFPIDMIKAMLKFMVYYLGLDGRSARVFSEKYPFDILSCAAVDRVVSYMGEDRYNEMTAELYELAKSLD